MANAHCIDGVSTALMLKVDLQTQENFQVIVKEVSSCVVAVEEGGVCRGTGGWIWLHLLLDRLATTWDW